MLYCKICIKLNSKELLTHPAELLEPAVPKKQTNLSISFAHAQPHETAVGVELPGFPQSVSIHQRENDSQRSITLFQRTCAVFWGRENVECIPQQKMAIFTCLAFKTCNKKGGNLVHKAHTEL